MKIENPIKTNLHGHGLPDYSPKWLERLGYKGNDNVAEIIAERTFKKNLGIYVLTNEPEFPGFRQYGRFDWVQDSARILSKQPSYEFSKLGNNAFLLKRSYDGEENETIFMRGQSLRITDKSLKTGNLREYEMLTIGRDQINDFPSFDEAFRYLSGEGLPAIGEHPLAYGHHGPLEEERLLDYCSNGKFTAVEHNAKMAMPDWTFFIPPIHLMLKQVRGARRSVNSRLERFLEPVLNPHVDQDRSFPLIANDDADLPEQIGAAPTEFPRNKIRLNTNGDNIVEDITRLVKTNQFKAHKDYLTLKQVIGYAYLIATT